MFQLIRCLQLVKVLRWHATERQCISLTPVCYLQKITMKESLNASESSQLTKQLPRPKVNSPISSSHEQDLLMKIHEIWKLSDNTDTVLEKFNSVFSPIVMINFMAHVLMICSLLSLSFQVRLITCCTVSNLCLIYQ